MSWVVYCWLALLRDKFINLLEIKPQGARKEEKALKWTLKMLRARDDLTQSQAAKKVGVSKETWSNWEKTIDLAEWQKKNQAYLDRRAKEKAEKEAAEKAAAESKQSSATENAEDADDTVDKPTESPVDEDQAQQESDSDHLDQEGTDEASEETDEVDLEGDASSKSEEESEEESEEDEKAVSVGQEESDTEESETALQVLDEATLELSRRRQDNLLKSLPVFLLAFLMMLVSIYFISPWSRIKQIEVTGNKQISSADVLAFSGILSEDYTLTTVLNQKAYAKAIEKHLPLVKSARMSYRFPLDFKIKIEEYYTIAYVKDGHVYHSALSSGAVLADQIEEEALPPSPLRLQLTDLAMVKKLVLALDQLDEGLVARLDSIELSATPATKDLLRILTAEGHELLVPLNEISKKLPYYEKILPKLLVPSVIDMEVGLYSYPK